MFGDWHLETGVLASVIAAGVSTAGLLSMVALGDWGRRNSAYFSSFAIGVLLVAVFFHLVPEAMSIDPLSWIAVLAGIGGMSVIGGGLRLYGSQNSQVAGFAFGYASIIALGFHSALDGVIYGTTFHSDDIFTGWLATIGLLLHEFPEGVIAFFLLREAGASTARSAIFAFFAASLTTIAGAIAVTFFFENIQELPFATMLGVSAGGLIYIMVFHLGPHARLTPSNRGYLLASIGVVISMAALILRHL